MFRNLVSSARVATLRATRTSALRWRVQRRFEAWTFFRGPCTGKCDASQDARLAQPWWRRATHWDAALQHPQARQFKQKLAKFCNIPRSECPSCPARRAATFDASCLHLLCVVLPYTGQEGQGQAQSQERRRDDNLHRHVSPTSGRVCFSSRVENLHRPFFTFPLSWCCMTFIWVEICTSKFE